MNRVSAAFVLICVMALGAGSADAACGGGGYRPYTPPGSSSSLPPASTAQPEAQNVSYSRAQPLVVNRLDNDRVNAALSQLNLTGRQWNYVTNAMDDVRSDTDRLTSNQEQALSRYNQCRGDCRAEQRRLSAANTALQNYDPNRELASRLNNILTPEQMSIYRDSVFNYQSSDTNTR